MKDDTRRNVERVIWDAAIHTAINTVELNTPRGPKDVRQLGDKLRALLKLDPPQSEHMGVPKEKDEK